MSYQYDLLEVFGGSEKNLGYAYAYWIRKSHALSMVTGVLQAGATILDIAAAQGNFSILLAEAGYEVTWNDLRAELADYVRSKLDSGILHYLPGNVFDLDCHDRYDAVLMTEMIEHVAHPDQLLRKIASLVKRGGYVIGTTPNGEYLRNRLPRFSDCPDPLLFESVQFRPDADGHIFLLHKSELETFAYHAGLDVVEIRFFTNPLTNGHMRTASVLPHVPKRLVDALEKLSESLPESFRRRLHFGMGFVLRRP